jgi:hypothetical protein
MLSFFRYQHILHRQILQIRLKKCRARPSVFFLLFNKRVGDIYVLQGKVK